MYSPHNKGEQHNRKNYWSDDEVHLPQFKSNDHTQEHKDPTLSRLYKSVTCNAKVRHEEEPRNNSIE
jgi:hypothetical protein